jgi:hypothetical protein
VEAVQVETGDWGVFRFTYRPDVVGNWTVSAWWQSDRGYYSSAYSEHLLLEVEAPKPSTNGGKGGNTGVPLEYIFALIVVTVVVVVSVAVYLIMKRARK